LADAIILPGPIAAASSVHQVGMSVAGIGDALAFWEKFLGVRSRSRTTVDQPDLGKIVGIPGVSIEAALIDLPGGVILELLDYQVDKRANPDATQNPGNIHHYLAVADARAAWKHAVDCGAKPVRREGPVEIDHGPSVGARVAYLRINDGVTLELFQRPGA
jgi:hypothetical protein